MESRGRTLAHITPPQYGRKKRAWARKKTKKKKSMGRVVWVELWATMTLTGRVLVQARDEAHRFVNKFHRKSRAKKRLSDPLQGVSGLGAKKLQLLIRHFGGRQGIKHASVNDLKTVPGIGNSLAQRIFDSLH